MYRDKIDKLAEKARNILLKIPFSKQEQIDFCTYTYGEPIVFYEVHTDGYYQVINERGNIRINKVAEKSDDMINYFVDEAVRNFAYRYELIHRRKFESNLRQVDEIMEQCYNYIDPTRKFIKDSYEDEIYIYLDLLDEYKKIAQEYRRVHPIEYLNIKNDIDYIADGKYVDSPYGGMSDVSKSMAIVRERIQKISESSSELKSNFDIFEKYYDVLSK